MKTKSKSVHIVVLGTYSWQIIIESAWSCKKDAEARKEFLTDVLNIKVAEINIYKLPLDMVYE